MIRTFYIIEDNHIAGIETELVSKIYNYGIYPKDNCLMVNGMRDKLTKFNILFDLESIARRKELGLLTHIKGLKNDFLNQLKEFGISGKDVKEAMSSGKNFYRNLRRDKNIHPINDNIKRAERFIVAY